MEPFDGAAAQTPSTCAATGSYSPSRARLHEAAELQDDELKVGGYCLTYYYLVGSFLLLARSMSCKYLSATARLGKGMSFPWGRNDFSKNFRAA
jgi:hypothetical protein